MEVEITHHHHHHHTHTYKLFRSAGWPKIRVTISDAVYTMMEWSDENTASGRVRGSSDSLMYVRRMLHEGQKK